MRKHPFAFIGIALSGVLFFSTSSSADAGEAGWNNCTQCHGQNGEGNKDVAAPPIAGMPAWYVESQLVKFRDGARGDHPDDAEGLRMRPMSKTLQTVEAVKAVAAHVAKLPKKKPAKTDKKGNPVVGQQLYTSCKLCHGDNGEGKKTLNGPPLAGQADWYLASQLFKFKKGIRGADPKDVTGATMRPMAATLATDQAVLDVVAYIQTLSGK